MPVAMLGPVRIHCQLFKDNGETHFSLWKIRHKCCLSLQCDEFNSPIGNSFRLANSHTRWRCNFKGLSKDGDGRIFLKISSPLSLIKAFRMNLISVGSILLDSTCNVNFNHFALISVWDSLEWPVQLFTFYDESAEFFCRSKKVSMSEQTFYLKKKY
jgi:hypothetical protein